MAALTTIALVASAAAAVGGYAQQKSAAKKQDAAADRARLADSLTAQANATAEQGVINRDKAAEQVKANEATAAEQLAQNADATVADEEDPSARRRRVQAQFNVTGQAGPSPAGSIRV